MKIISRAQWGARPPDSRTTVAMSARKYFVVHHSGAPATQTVRAIQDWCMDGRGFADIDYNHLVRATTGEIYEGRGWNVVGAHTTGYNTSGVGICVIGNNQISDAAKQSVLWLYDEYNRRCSRTLTIKGHRQLATTGTDCPGDRIASWLAAGMPRPKGDDMTTDEVKAAAKAALRELILTDEQVRDQLRALPWQYDGRGLHAAGTALEALADSQDVLAALATVTADVAAIKAAITQPLPRT